MSSQASNSLLRNGRSKAKRPERHRFAPARIKSTFEALRREGADFTDLQFALAGYVCATRTLNAVHVRRPGKSEQRHPTGNAPPSHHSSVTRGGGYSPLPYLSLTFTYRLSGTPAGRQGNPALRSEGNPPAAAMIPEPMDVRDGSDLVGDDMEDDRTSLGSALPDGSPHADGASSQAENTKTFTSADGTPDPNGVEGGAFDGQSVTPGPKWCSVKVKNSIFTPL